MKSTKITYFGLTGCLQIDVPSDLHKSETSEILFLTYDPPTLLRFLVGDGFWYIKPKRTCHRKERKSPVVRYRKRWRVKDRLHPTYSD